MNNNNKQVLTDKEINLILKIASKFNINPKTAYRLGNEYLLYDINNYVYKINRVYEKRGEIFQQFKLIQILNEKNINNTLRVLQGVNGNYFYKRHKTYYYVTYYDNGGNIHFENEEHVDLLINSLCDFHNSSAKIKLEDLLIKDKTFNISKKIMDNLYSFERFSNIIKSRNIVSAFDELYLKSIPYYMNMSLIALSQVKDVSLNSSIESGDIQKVICINRFKKGELTINNNCVFFNNLSKSSIGIRVFDLYEIILAALAYCEGGDYLRVTLDIVEKYNNCFKLTKEEIQILFALIIFPRKFYRLGTRRYNQRKVWSEEKYLLKLKNAMAYSKRSKHFINGFIEYINNYEY